MSVVPRTGFGLTDDFFSPFFSPSLGFPDITREMTRALAPLAESSQLATRGMPIDVVSSSYLDSVQLHGRRVSKSRREPGQQGPLPVPPGPTGRRRPSCPLATGLAAKLNCAS
jgi:hypothetical protein